MINFRLPFMPTTTARPARSLPPADRKRSCLMLGIPLRLALRSGQTCSNDLHTTQNVLPQTRITSGMTPEELHPLGSHRHHSAPGRRPSDRPEARTATPHLCT